MCTYGLYKLDYFIVVAGRFLFGIGLENYNICEFNIINRWFPKKELSFSMGFVIAAGRMSMVISTFVYPMRYDDTRLLWKAAILGVFVCVFSFFSIITLSIFDNTLSSEKEK